MTISTVPIPPPASQSFSNGISHPDLWLWDSWCYNHGETLQLYCLALAKRGHDGADICHSARNDYPFHIRHFQSRDQGQSWKDCGAVLSPNTPAKTGQDDSFYNRNVWSGSATRLPDDTVLMGFTGLRAVDDQHLFLQTIGLATSTDGSAFDHIQAEPISCPRRDYDAIIAAGYYLGPKASLGSKDGEDGGPILAWRDPYVFIDTAQSIHCFWSAKISAKVGAIAHATLVKTKHGYAIETLHPPITLPDGKSITQAEVPKIYYDADSEIYYCLISACDRLYEGQDDSEVSKTLRLYKAGDLRGPWYSYRVGSSLLPGLENMFGASIIDTDFSTGVFKLIAPITEQAEPHQQLTFAPVQSLNIYAKVDSVKTPKTSRHKTA